MTGSGSHARVVSSWQPAMSSAAAARSRAAAQAGSTGNGLDVTTATRTPPGAGRVTASSALMAANAVRRSATDRAMGPRTLSRVGSGRSCGTRPGEGRRPRTPQQADGMRIEPPMSSPEASVQRPAATAAALPPLEPPGV